jgi:hypothetical protein
LPRDPLPLETSTPRHISRAGRQGPRPSS